ncbi:DNA-directed RNA polymerase iii 130 kda polypeptide [Colletotrichum camelliae]|nr:DNA-directed RNA polymerase iii 130 kda polypeptide [Colletotrichum camelliae]
MQDDGFEALLEPFYNGKKLTDPISTKEDKFQLLPAFLKVKGLVKQHIDSYNFFVENEIKEIVRANRIIRSDVNSSFWLEFTDIRVEKPSRVDFNDIRAQNEVTPMECRLRDMTYAAPIMVDIAYIRDKSKIVRKNVPLGRLPVMLKSSICRLGGATNAEMSRMNECPLDPGGYFIINGTEKVILIQEQLSKNRVIVEADEKNNIITASVTSSTHERKSKTYVTLKKDRILLTANILVEGIPIVIILKALGGLSDYEIMQLVAGDNGKYQDEFLVQFEEATKVGVYTQQQALEYIGARVKMGKSRVPFSAQVRRNHVEEALDALANLIIAHVPIEGLDFYPKAVYVAFMTRRVLMAQSNLSLVDDRDFVGNKRLELAGQLLSLLFEDLFKQFCGNVKSSIDKVLKKDNRAVPLDAVNMISNHANMIGQGINRAIQTGNWTVKRFNMNRAGVTHVLSRLSYISALGMMTRISSQFEKTRKVSGPRALQPSQWGMLCTSDTPEGEACGLVKNLALMTHITTNVEEEPVKRWVFTLDAGVEPIRNFSGGEMHREGSFVIHINGTPFALTRYPKRFAGKFRTMRRRGWISPFVSIHINNHFNAVHIATDEGRICRPYIIVKNGKPKLKAEHLRLLQLGKATFDDFLTHGIVEYLDVNEENDTLVALYETDVTMTTTHMEIEPFTVLGAVAGLIPFPHHNQSPRNTYQCAMGKQAIGAIAYNQFNRIDTLLYTLVYPQRPMVISKTIQLVNYDKLPAGQNATVIVMSYSGYDIEDALVLNKASCDRGFGRCQVFRKYTAELQKYPNGRRERIGDPVNDENGRTKKHEALDDDGLAIVGYKINSGETMIKKETPLDTGSTGIGMDRGPSEFRDSSISYRIADPAYIDKVMVSHTERETMVVKVQTRQTRRPELGDKFSSRHGQKGVVGIIVDQEDLPFSDTGLVPDIIMNPHGFPSRMTVGKLLECLTGKASVLDGRKDYGFGDAFRSHPLEQMSAALVDHGFSWEGKDYFTSGITGEPLEAYIFNGPIYYQRLKHMVQDKMHSRSRGPRAILTRQPTEGRSRDGGLRLGEMERDCLIAYGASQLLLERLMISSDGTQLDICQQCGLFGYKGYCHTCKSTREVTQMTMPYAAKLLVQELISMNVGVRLQLADEFPHPRSAPSGVRAAAASPLTSQLWSSCANPTSTPLQTPNVPTHPSTAAATVAAAAVAATATAPPPSPPPFVLARQRTKEGELPKRYFNPSNTVLADGGKPGKKPDNENNANLGKTLRILQEHLPKVLQSPLPQEILAPNISLHLFPTTHPHLPTVSGRVAYTAALWSAPIAWNRLPLVGNVRLSIISERVTKHPLPFAPLRSGAVPEQLVVRWCAGGKNGSTTTTTAAVGGAATGKDGDKPFTGLFVFQFDSEGRILSHTIETVQESGDWEKGVGAKVVGLTDWLLGGMRRGSDSPSPACKG